jgi:CRISPR-associated exonuclease Cas4
VAGWQELPGRSDVLKADACPLGKILGEALNNGTHLQGRLEWKRLINNNKQESRALPGWSERLGLTGKCDVVEILFDGTIYPFEYKHSERRRLVNDDPQLGARTVSLEEMTGKPVPFGAIYHTSSRRSRKCANNRLTTRLVEETVAPIRAMLASGRLTPPVNDARCKECSLNAICQPAAMAAKMEIKQLRIELSHVKQ